MKNMKYNKKNIGIGMTALLAATAAASVFAAGSTTSTQVNTGSGFGRHGSHTETEAERKEHKTAMATSLAQALGTTVDAITSQLDAGKSPRDIIKASGMDEATVRAQLEASREADMKTRLAADVASGKLTQAQADEMITDMKNHEGKGGKGGHGMPKDDGQMLADMASVLGITKDALQAQITAGKGLKDIVSASGISETDFRTKMDTLRQASMKTRLAADVASGKLTQAQADEMIANMTNHKDRGHFDGDSVENRNQVSSGTSNF